MDLSSYAGKTIDNFYVVADAGTPVGNWNIYYGEIAIYSADGTVTTIYDRAPSESFSYFTGGGETNTDAYVSRSKTDNDAEAPEVSTTYYVGNQVGSTEMTLAAGGWPVAQDTIYPYGMEPSPSVAPNRYRFAGMERDATSGLDHTPYRQYAALMGRWMTPDPYNGSYDLANPQSFNRYLYVNGNPLVFNDPSGLDPFSSVCPSVGVCSIGPWNPAVLGPIGSIIGAVLDFYPMIQAIFGLGGPATFNGNVAASQSGKNVPQTLGSGHFDSQGTFIPDKTYAIHANAYGTGLNINPTPSSIIEKIPLVSLAYPWSLRSHDFQNLVPGTHWCGPGGWGGTTGPLDAACMAHDACYGAGGFNAIDNINPFLSPSRGAALQQCNQTLCNTLNGNPAPGAVVIDMYFSAIGFYSCTP